MTFVLLCCTREQPPPLREYGLVHSLDLYRQSLIALEDFVGEMSKKSFIGRETETGGGG